MSGNVIHVDVSILGQSVRLSCKEGEDQALRDAASYLDQKMMSIRDSGKVRGTDKIAVLAGLSIATELLATRTSSGPWAGATMLEVQNKIQNMHQVLDAALMPQENLF